MFSSIQLSSISSCSGVNPTAPRTPKPPALLTATTTSRQWVKAKIGNSMPSSSQIGVRMSASLGRERFVGRAPDVEAVRVGEDLLVAVGGRVVEDDLVPLLDRHAPQLGVPRGRAPE